MKRLLFALTSCFAVVACRTPSTSGTADSSPNASATHPTSAQTYAKPSGEEIRAKLTPLQYEVTQNAATEPPFRNAYWDNHEAGLYVDVVTGQPLFSSKDKFDSGTGWPSFVRPVDEHAVVTKTDRDFGMTRTEVRSSSGQSHLGHVFEDGPAPTHLRYCINSASLRFIPASRLQAEGYGAFASQVGGTAAPPPADSNNACAAPPPGERAGCETTLATAILGGDDSVAKAVAAVPGVLQVDRGTLGKTAATRIVFDPKVLTYERLLDAWARSSPVGQAKILAVTPEQKTDADAWKAHAPSGHVVTVERGGEDAFSETR